MENDPIKKWFKLLRLQYDPVEKRLFANISDEQKKQYQSLNYAKKIHILDGIVAQGL